MTAIIGIATKLMVGVFVTAGASTLIEKFTGTDIAQFVLDILLKYIPDAFKFLTASLNLLKSSLELLPTDFKLLFLSVLPIMFGIMIVKFIKN